MLLRLAALGLLAALAVFLVGATAEAQTTPTSVTLVDNTGEADESTLNFSRDRAYWFETGSSADGYTLTSVELDMTVGDATGTDPPYSVAIYTESGNAPVSMVGSALTKPASLSTGLNTFTATGDGIDLSANTWYGVVLKVTGNGTSGPLVRTTASGDQDGLAGWDVAARHSSTSRGTNNWTVNTTVGSPQMKVNGYAKNYQVGNIGQTRVTTSPLQYNFDFAQAFTTGRNAAGYTLTKAQIDIEVATPANSNENTYTVKVHSNNSSNQPDTSSSLGTLSRSGLTANGVNTFTASGSGIDLAAETTYWIVIDVTATVSTGDRDLKHKYTAAGAEDTGTMAGWSIADTSLNKAWNLSSWTSGPVALQIALLGTARSDIVTLFDNTSETDNTTLGFSQDRALWFNTGDSADGYKLTSVQLDMALSNASGTDPTYSLAIHQTSGTAGVGTMVGTALTKPSSLTDGLNTFTAAGDGLDLNPDTRYGVVLRVTAGGTSGPSFRTTSSVGATSRLSGWWSNVSSVATRGMDHWDLIAGSGRNQIKLDGYAKNHLAGNLAQARRSTEVNTGNDVAQAFTTGANAGGYTLTKVQIDFEVEQPSRPNDPTYTVQLHSNNSSNEPDTSSSLGALTRTGLTDNGVNTFTASGTGIELAAETTYWVVVDVTASPSSGSRDLKYKHTDADAEDPGRQLAWSIADGSLFRVHTITTWTALTTAALQMALVGTAKAADTTAPTVESATIAADGTTLTVQFDETNLLGHNSRDYWTYKVNGVSQGTVHATHTDLTAGRVNITLSPAVNSGQTVLLSYAAPATNRLRDQAGNALESFTDEAVTNNSNQQPAGQPPQTPPQNPPANPGGSGAPAEPPPIEPNLAYSPVEWSSNPHAMTQAFPLAMNEISSNRTTNGSGALNLSAIAASLSPERAARSRGYYLSTRVYGLAERPELVRRAPGGLSTILGVGETRHRVVRGSPLVWIKLWHVYQRPATGINTIERLGGPFYPRLDPLLAEPVEVCLPAPRADAAIAVRLQGESAWTVLETTERDGRICADTVRVGWLILVEAPE